MSLYKLTRKNIQSVDLALRKKMAKKSQKNVKRVQTQPPNTLQGTAREESPSNCHFHRKSGCTYAYKVIPIVIYISALYKPMNNITKIFTDRKCYTDLTEK